MIAVQKRNLLKPNKRHTDLIYSCPKCKNQIWVSCKETRWPGKKLCDNCGYKLHLRPVKKVKLIYMERLSEPFYTKSSVKPNVKPNVKPDVKLNVKSSIDIDNNGIDIENALDILVATGYKKSDCLKVIYKLNIENSMGSQEIVTLVLKNL